MNVFTRTMALCVTALAGAANPIAAATIDVDVVNFRYTPNDVTINVGDTVRWTNSGGQHNVWADNDSFGNEISFSNWTFSHTFNSAGDFRYYCQAHSAPGADININMNGIIRVRAAEPPAFVINQGIPGSWFNPATSGSGLLIDVASDPKFMFVAWFTYEKAQVPGAVGAQVPMPKVGSPENRWMTAGGSWDGNTANLTLFKSSGGIFDNGATVTTAAVGTLTLTFADCAHATASYNIPGESLSGTFPISRSSTLGMAVLCQSLVPAAADTPGDE